MITTIPPSDWDRRLREFSARNACRQTTWERRDSFADREVGLRREHDAPFLGATFDPWDRKIRIMFADASGIPYCQTSAITDATSLAIVTDAAGRETAMRIERPSGEVVLRFDPPPDSARWIDQQANPAAARSMS